MPDVIGDLTAEGEQVYRRIDHRIAAHLDEGNKLYTQSLQLANDTAAQVLALEQTVATMLAIINSRNFIDGKEDLLTDLDNWRTNSWPRMVSFSLNSATYGGRSTAFNADTLLIKGSSATGGDFLPLNDVNGMVIELQGGGAGTFALDTFNVPLEGAFIHYTIIVNSITTELVMFKNHGDLFGAITNSYQEPDSKVNGRSEGMFEVLRNPSEGSPNRFVRYSLAKLTAGDTTTEVKWRMILMVGNNMIALKSS